MEITPDPPHPPLPPPDRGPNDPGGNKGHLSLRRGLVWRVCYNRGQTDENDIKSPPPRPNGRPGHVTMKGHLTTFRG